MPVTGYLYEVTKSQRRTRKCRTRLKISTALFHFILLSQNNKNNYPIKQIRYRPAYYMN